MFNIVYASCLNQLTILKNFYQEVYTMILDHDKILDKGLLSE